MDIKVYVQFENEIGYTEITDYILADSIKIEKYLYSKKLKFEQDVFSAETIYDNNINSKFNTATTWMKAYVIKGNDRIFTGAVYPNTKDTYKGISSTGVSFEIVDNSYLLDKDNEEFTYPYNVMDTPYKVFNPLDTEHSIIHQCLYKCNIFDNKIASDISIDESIESITFKKASKTYDKIIDAILYEFHYSFYFDEYGVFHLVDWEHKEIKPEVVITEKDVRDSGIDRERTLLDYDGYIGKYTSLVLLENKILYRSGIDIDSPKMLISDEVYPVESTKETVYQVYSEDLLPTDCEIVNTSNQYLDSVYDEGIVIEKEIYTPTKAEIILRNMATEEKYINTFDIRGDVLIETDEGEKTLPSNSTKTEEISLSYVHTSEQVDSFLQALYNNVISYGAYEYTFDSTKEYKKGTEITLITNEYSANAIIRSVEYETKTEQYTYHLDGLGVHKVQETKGSLNVKSGIKLPTDGENAISIQIFSSNGNIFRKGTINTSLDCRVFSGSEEITDSINESLFNWKRTSTLGNQEDEKWNTSSKAMGRKTIELTPEDVVGRTVFSCEVNI